MEGAFKIHCLHVTNIIFSCSIEIGKDADLVIWERHPLRLGARPKHVIIDGALMDFKKSWTKSVAEQFEAQEKKDKTEAQVVELSEKERHYLPEFSTGSMMLEDHGLNNPMAFSDACSDNVDSFVLRNVGEIYLDAEEKLTAKEEGKALYIVVNSGIISCIGTKCDRDHIDWPAGSPVFEMGGAVIVPVSYQFIRYIFNNSNFFFF